MNLLFEACETRHCVNVSIVNDEELEQTESFAVTLKRTPGLDYRIILTPANTMVYITDDESKIVPLVICTKHKLYCIQN